MIACLICLSIARCGMMATHYFLTNAKGSHLAHINFTLTVRAQRHKKHPPLWMHREKHWDGGPLVGVMEGVEKPGNLGAIIRTAAAACLAADRPLWQISGTRHGTPSSSARNTKQNTDTTWLPKHWGNATSLTKLQHNVWLGCAFSIYLSTFTLHRQRRQPLDKPNLTALGQNPFRRHHRRTGWQTEPSNLESTASMQSFA